MNTIVRYLRVINHREIGVQPGPHVELVRHQFLGQADALKGLSKLVSLLIDGNSFTTLPATWTNGLE